VEAKITSKGQITIPKAVRDQLGARTGDVLLFVPENGGFRIEKLVPEDPFEKYRGYFKDLEGIDIDELIDDWRGS
jgi:AbrB family looped-hinge helix DNA binding protein